MSHLNYGCQIWGQNYSVNKNNLINLQNKSIRLIRFQQNSFDLDILYSLSKIMKLDQMIYLLNSAFEWDVIHKNIPMGFNNYFKFTGNIHNHNLKSVSCNNLSILSKQTYKFGIKSIKNYSIHSWNSLPSEIKKSTNQLNRNRFIKQAKEFIMKMQDDTTK